MPYSAKTPPGRAGLGDDCSLRRSENTPRLSTARLRLQRLAEALHALGPKPLFHFLNELERGADLRLSLEEYAALPGDLIECYGGDRFAPGLHVISGVRR
jgi:hypothetical protein